jgi:hypothetical protein
METIKKKMKRLILKTKDAVANYSGAMENTRDHFKNGAILKSHTSRINFLTVK